MENEELDNLLSQSHKDISIQDFDGKQISCIEFTQERFDKIIDCIAGKPLSVNTDLNILQDGLGHVFVEISLKFSLGGLDEKILVNANEHLDFFQLLSQNGILSIASKDNPGKVFMIQLPKLEKVLDALNIITQGLSKISDN
jgi:hypothetical protein